MRRGGTVDRGMEKEGQGRQKMGGQTKVSGTLNGPFAAVSDPV